MKKSILLLSDGTLFEGLAFGCESETIGEVCFNTGMTGYQEILTDPSYCKQIVVMTAPQIGNYGVNSDDVESNRIQVAGFVIKEESIVDSNWRSEQKIDNYLRNQEIVGIKGVDTRAIASHIRDNGAMNGIISSIDQSIRSLEKKLNAAPKMEGLDLAREVSTRKEYSLGNENSSDYKVAVIDFGIKKNILNLMIDHGCSIKVFPADVSASKIIEFNPDGLFLSNGPGDPAAMTYGIDTVRTLLGIFPIFGICLGHQILSIALGAKTYKLKFGHRGLNHPVRNNETGAIEITSQNHGFSVDLDSLPENVLSTHINLNDNTSAGIRCDDLNAFSVQYHPESSPGPHDSIYLFEKFTRLMKNAKKK